MTGRNVGDLLNAKHITWGWFQGGFRPHGRPRMARRSAAPSQRTRLATRGPDYIPHHEPFQYYQQTANPHHLPPSSADMIGQDDQANHQYDLADFYDALGRAHLPAVSFVKAKAYQDGHAGYSDPLDEQTFLVDAHQCVEQSPVLEGHGGHHHL